MSRFRRTIMGSSGGNLTLSAASISGLEPTSGSTTFSVYFNEVLLKSNEVQVVSTNNAVNSTSYNSSTGVVTVSYGTNYSTSSRSDTIQVNYRSASAIFTLYQRGDYVTDQYNSNSGFLRFEGTITFSKDYARWRNNEFGLRIKSNANNAFYVYRYYNTVYVFKSGNIVTQIEKEGEFKLKMGTGSGYLCSTSSSGTMTHDSGYRDSWEGNLCAIHTECTFSTSGNIISYNWTATSVLGNGSGSGTVDKTNSNLQ